MDLFDHRCGWSIQTKCCSWSRIPKLCTLNADWAKAKGPPLHYMPLLWWSYLHDWERGILKTWLVDSASAGVGTKESVVCRAWLPQYWQFQWGNCLWQGQHIPAHLAPPPGVMSVAVTVWRARRLPWGLAPGHSLWLKKLTCVNPVNRWCWWSWGLLAWCLY